LSERINFSFTLKQPAGPPAPYLGNEKSKILAKLFRAYINKDFDWDHFVHLSACLTLINPKGFAFLSKLADANFIIPEDRTENDIQRDYETEPILSACGIAYDAGVWSSGFYVTQMGKDLYNFGLK